MSNSLENVKEHFEWEDENFLEYFLGLLPKMRHTSEQNKSLEKKLSELRKIYNSYDYFLTDQSSFLQEIKNKLNEIHDINPHWYGLNLDKVKYYTNLHHACILTGVGGIGKSYFIYQLEKEISNKNISHLCIYGKYQEIAFDIDFEEINLFAKETPFVFIVDAFNELSEKNKDFILNGIQKLLNNKNIRIIVTYRSFALKEEYCKKLSSLISTNETFPGISFEAAIDIISKYPIKELYRYTDILFSNNALLISKLIKILVSFPEDKNSINSITYILEHDFKETIGKVYWEHTKKITKWMYDNNTKGISLSNIDSLIPNSRDYIEKLISTDFIFTYKKNEETYVYFQIETIHDFLIARYFFDDSKNKSDEEIIKIIIEKIEAFSSAREAFIVGLFDKFGNNYNRIYKILKKTSLLDELRPEVLQKVKFDAENIPLFLSVFEQKYPVHQFVWFAGFTDKPFNCINFQNQLLLDSYENQLSVLSKILSINYDADNFARRLKNILYFVNYTNVDESALDEYFYTALWSSSAANEDVRIIARKLLFDIVRIKESYISKVITLFPKIYDLYIQDAIIEILFYHKHNEEITQFFMRLKEDYSFLSAVNLARISNYLNLKFDYINWEKKNLFSNTTRKISDVFERILFRIDAYAPSLLHFRYWDRNRIDNIHPRFLYIDKKTIKYINNSLEKKFSCVKCGECKGSNLFKKSIKKLYKIQDKSFPVNSFLKSLEKVFNNILNMYSYSSESEDVDLVYRNFSKSLLRKLIVISQDLFYGSLMCNYFTDEFSSYDDAEELIGYKVYDPLQYEPSQNITAPIPTYVNQIEKLQDKVLNSIDFSMKKDESWVKNATLTKENVLSLITKPVLRGKLEWMILSTKISLDDSTNNIDSWRDNYDISCCTSKAITLNDDETDRELTIEHRDYYGLLENYSDDSPEPELCMYVKEISSYTELLDETNLLLPPAKLIKDLNLKPDYQNLSWIDSKGETVIYCNNNKSDYYKDFIKESIFIRKDYYDEYIKTHPLKYFVFTERLISDHGFEDDTCFNLEIEKGKITKEFLHYKAKSILEDRKHCSNCPHGLDKEHKKIKNTRLFFPIGIDMFTNNNIEIFNGKEE
ncbi:MAG: hypothetical protein J6R67_05895 [Treponema sp.]|nr:hypothetical protein [Treponema sp.]